MKLAGRVTFDMARAAALVGLALAAAWSLRVAVSDYYAGTLTVSKLEQAIRWSPGQSLNYVRLSALISDTAPTRAVELLQRAVVLNPLDSRSWIDLALRREMSGNPAVAEQDLLRAASIDRQYLPRWSLANFYFRRNDTARFWHWAQSAAEMLYGDPQPLFRLCDGLVGDENLIERLHMRRPDFRASYLSYVLARDHVELIHPVAKRLMIDGREPDVPIILSACDRLLSLQKAGQALDLWNGLATAGRIPYRPLSAADGAVTNSSFSSAPTSQGFDWRTPDIAGVSTVREDATGGLRLIFSGRQPESCVPLSQVIPIRESTHYELRYVYATAGIADGTGLSWSVEFTGVGQAAATSARIPSREGRGAEVFSFDSPPGCDLARLSLMYRRATGTTRIEGRIVLREVQLRRVG